MNVTTHGHGTGGMEMRSGTTNEPSGCTGALAAPAVLNSADHLGEHMGEAPVIIVPASRGGDAASVYPGLQNLFLAARPLGLDTMLTTAQKLREDAVRAVLDIPAEVETWALIPVGYPTGRWGEAERRPIDEITYWDGWKTTKAR